MMDYYTILNYLEGTLWLFAALVIRKIIAITKPHHKTACNIAIAGFFLFGISDFIEGSLKREFHLSLWLLKIACGAIFLTARIHYVGMKNFKYTDRYFLFFVFGLSIAIAVIILNMNTE